MGALPAVSRFPLSHVPQLQPSIYRSAIDAAVSLGNVHRNQAVGSRLASGCPLRTLALGGSSTAGHKLPRESPDLYHARVAAWLRNYSSGVNAVEHIHTNGGTPAIGPEYVEKCLATQMNGPADLIFVEFSQNLQAQDSQHALERLLRRLLLLPT